MRIFRLIFFAGLSVFPLLIVAERWKPVGTAGCTEGYAGYHSLAVDTAGTPILSFSDGTRDNRPSVMRYDVQLNSWNYVGNPALFESVIAYTALAVDTEL